MTNDRLTGERVTNSSGGAVIHLTHAHDLLGRVTSTTRDGWVTTHRYDLDGRLDQETGPGQVTTYGQNGRRRQAAGLPRGCVERGRGGPAGL